MRISPRSLVSTALMFALALALSSAVRAATNIDFITIRYQDEPPQANIRVDLENTSGADFTGPINVTLYVRANAGEQWRQIFQYPPTGEVKAGSHVALDYFTPADNVDPAIRSGAFQIRAVAVFPDGHTSRMFKSYP